MNSGSGVSKFVTSPVVCLTESAQLALTPLSISQTVAGEQGFAIVSGASTTNRTAQGNQNRESSAEKKNYG
jgi:hypothetical protein